jgi:hypothetical protein
MRHWSTRLALVFVAVFGLQVRAADKPSADYQKAMKDLGAFAQSIDKAVMADDFDAVAKLAASAQADFEVVEKFWTSKAQDATKLAQNGAKAAADLGVVAGLKSHEGIVYSAKEITDLCATCHMVHRETMPDGTFQIK